MTETNAEGGLTPEHAEVFARGLFHLANVDGLEEREENLIKEFLVESGAAVSFESLKDSAFSPIEAAMVLDTTWIRRVFVKAAVALVKADGKFSDAERHAVGEIADAFGMSNAEFGDIELEAERTSLE
jgi:tellurite resistance protein